MKKLFITANETYFICNGEHCLQTWKDDGKILENFAGKPGKYLRGKEPNIASHGDLAIQKQFSRSRFIRFRSKSKKSQQQKFRLKICFESLKSLNVLKMLFRCILKFLKIQWYDRNNLATLNQKQFWRSRSIQFHKNNVKILFTVFLDLKCS